MANDRDPETNAAAFLGAELRRARMAAGIKSQDKLAQMLGYDRSVIAKAETGERPPSEDVMEALVKALGLGQVVTRLASLARRSTGIPAWFLDWVAIERDAVTLHTWQSALIPGLLQTPEYARAVLASWRLDTDGDIEAKLAARTGRQAIVDRDDPPDLCALLDESVLHRCIGSAAIMAGQLEHLARAARRPNVTIQLVPEQAGAYAGLSGAFWVATAATGQQAAHLETGVQGMTVIEPALVRKAARLFEMLRSDALPWTRSLELIAEAISRWTQLAAPGGARQVTPVLTVASASKSASTMT
jgi:transcriptional regulator with XRE-family HTH domain